jgi:glycosyltransferase involved in cell wall biosynthesis
MAALSVALVSFKFPPRYSGYGNQLYAVSRKMAEQCGDSIRFIVVTGSNGATQPPQGISRVVRLAPRFLARISAWLEFYCFVLSLPFWLVIASRRYQLIHCVKAGPESAVCLLVGRCLRKPVIVKVAQDEIRGMEQGGASKLKRLLRRRRVHMLRRASAVVAISEQIRQELVNAGIPAAVIRALSNGVNTDRFRPVESTEERAMLRRSLSLREDAVVGLFVGSLTARKGVAELIAALRGLRTSRSYQFIFCGPEYELGAHVRRECEQLTDRQAGSVRYDGNVADVEKYMRAADFIVLPSYSEGLPNVLLEASLAGLAIVGTDIGGTRDVVSAVQNGILVPVGDACALAAAIGRLIDDDAYRRHLQECAVRGAARRYSLDQVAGQYQYLYAEVLS